MSSALPFKLFGMQHPAGLAVLTGSGVLIVCGARYLQDRRRKLLAWTLAGLLLAYASAIYIQEAMMGGLHASYSLPLQFCDWVLIACVIALVRPARLAGEMAYFWGFGGTLQAVITPDVATAFPSWRFIEFFWGHGVTLLSIIFIVAAPGFRPRRWSVLRMLAIVNIYGLTALGLDLLFGWNYGYLRHKPAGASLFDYLGPWPWYLLSIEALAAGIFMLLSLPWIINWGRFPRFSESGRYLPPG